MIQFSSQLYYRAKQVRSFIVNLDQTKKSNSVGKINKFLILFYHSVSISAIGQLEICAKKLKTNSAIVLAEYYKGTSRQKVLQNIFTVLQHEKLL